MGAALRCCLLVEGGGSLYLLGLLNLRLLLCLWLRCLRLLRCLSRLLLSLRLSWLLRLGGSVVLVELHHELTSAYRTLDQFLCKVLLILNV